MARPIWKGSIAFGLVHIPVDLHSAHEAHELSFTQLDKRDFSPIGYRRYNKATGKEVEWADIVKGHEEAEGEYVVLTDAELKRVNPEATQTIDIVAFVERSEIDPFFFAEPYYLSPGKNGQKPYALLRETLERTGKVGIAQVVLRTRQHLAALVAHGEALALVMLRYAHELRDPKGLDIPTGSLAKLGVTAREVTMAEKLVDEMVEKWKPTQYADTYRDEVVALIKKKAKAGEVNSVSAVKAPKVAKAAHVTDLMALLKQSLNGGRRTKPANDHKAHSKNGHSHGGSSKNGKSHAAENGVAHAKAQPTKKPKAKPAHASAHKKSA